jgi:hypothetical protein
METKMDDLENGILDTPAQITRREAILRVTALLGGVALVGGSSLLTACSKENEKARDTASARTAFSEGDIAFLDEVADTILPTTATSPGAKAAKTGAFMALMVTDGYSPSDQEVFREGMRKIDEASRKANNVTFMKATPEQRLALLNVLDKEQKSQADERKKESLKRVQTFLAQPSAPSDANAAPEITAAPATHYFRMMKELALLGYFTSEIGYTQAQRYVESPGRFDPCVPYKPDEKAWASHA